MVPRVSQAHSSQTGDAAKKLKRALADTEEILKEYAEMEEPSLEPTFNKTKLENENENRDYIEFCKLFDQLMTDDDFFSGDISKSSRTDTNKDELKH